MFISMRNFWKHISFREVWKTIITVGCHKLFNVDLNTLQYLGLFRLVSRHRNGNVTSSFNEKIGVRISMKFSRRRAWISSGNLIPLRSVLSFNPLGVHWISTSWWLGQCTWLIPPTNMNKKAKKPTLTDRNFCMPGETLSDFSSIFKFRV